jgi:hypothetical protein
MAGGLLQYFTLTTLWALSLNGGGAAAHGTRRRGCAPGLGGIRILVEGAFWGFLFTFFVLMGL